jgi:D-alanine-D-alanine ligase
VKVAIVAGGRTPEREVSLHGGHRVTGALRDLGHDVHLIDPVDDALVETLQRLGPEIAYLMLHGKEGEDGTVQRLLDLLQIPYTGSDPFGCEVAFDKRLAKAALRAAGVATPAWVVIEDAALRDLGAGAALTRITDRVGLPCVVKPSRSGSALGVGFVEDEAGLAPAVMAALSFSDAAVIESFVDGTEVAVGVIGPALESLPLVEVVPKGGVYDYAARYTSGATEYFAPARVDGSVAAVCAASAQRACAELGLRDIARLDMMIDRAGTPWVLDVNVAPGMTETSLVPMGALASGRSFPELCATVLRSGVARTGASER